MTNIYVVFPKQEEARSIRQILIKNGFTVNGVSNTGATLLQQIEEVPDPIVVCGYKLPDMMYSQLWEYLPEDGLMLLLAPAGRVGEYDENGITCLSMPLKVHALVEALRAMVEQVEWRRRKRRQRAKVRVAADEAVLSKAKQLLQESKGMSEQEAHAYLQKCSMNSGTGLVEVAKMVLTLGISQMHW